ncbi:hypothetical protein BO82DRAFT_72200 [Aspergillus uvarum CBS 121591]|uniref:Uncharacterized protein n=1 Tax=Aspergillus uvarum CBS 121591 TaxID=1448315 RepID=A0A319CF92_9EURO|nr:hypothetical protein BO82DRAFT_72200 [Aspergillus uvarum CBS 121591]PYH82007.1 hypothetical protein BO82DRAFT_72200 [Aspergillus uvarum CBS 121591]
MGARTHSHPAPHRGGGVIRTGHRSCVNLEQISHQNISKTTLTEPREVIMARAGGARNRGQYCPAWGVFFLTAVWLSHTERGKIGMFWHVLPSKSRRAWHERRRGKQWETVNSWWGSSPAIHRKSQEGQKDPTAPAQPCSAVVVPDQLIKWPNLPL